MKNTLQSFRKCTNYLHAQKEVFIAYLTDSHKQGSSPDAQAVREERRAEANAVASSLGIPRENLFFLGGVLRGLLGYGVQAQVGIYGCGGLMYASVLSERNFLTLNSIERLA